MSEKKEVKRPICPYCKEEMIREQYTGYYDSFDCWICNCGDGDVPIDREYRGAYA